MAVERPFAATYDASSATLSLSGIVDSLSMPELRQALLDATAEHTRSTTIDLSELDFLPSTGLGLLAGAVRQAGLNGARVELRARRGCLASRVLAVSGLNHTLV